MTYTSVLIIHLFCAIIFIGFVFADTVILPAMKKVLNEQDYQKIMQVISNRARKVFPFALLVLVITGGFMVSKFINSSLGYFSSNLQLLLMLKIFFALLIVCGVIYSLLMRILKKTPHPRMKHFHKFVLINGIFIIILAKLMFVV